MQDPALDGEHIASRVPAGLGRVPDAATVTTDQRRWQLPALGRLQAHHHQVGQHRVGDLLDHDGAELARSPVPRNQHGR